MLFDRFLASVGERVCHQSRSQHNGLFFSWFFYHFNIKADCACKKADADASIGATAPVVVKKSTGRHGNPSSNDIKLAGGSSTENNKQVNSAIGGATRYTVKLDTDADVQWVMQVIKFLSDYPPIKQTNSLA